MALNSVKILQHNVLAWTYQKRLDYSNIYSLEDPDVILLNEHGCKEEERIKLYNYDVYQRNHSNEQHAGVAIAVKKGIEHNIIDDYIGDYLAVKIMTNQGPIIVGTGYQPLRHQQHFPLNTILKLLRRQEPVLFAGDLNARHRVLNHNNNNLVGETINDLIRQGSIIHAGPEFKTYITPRASGTPDIVLTNDNFNLNTYIYPGPLTSSDHIPVVIKVSASPIQIPVPPRYAYNRANWEKFQQDLTTFTIPDLNNQLTAAIDTHLERWFSAVIKAMDDNIPKVHHRTIPHIRISNEIKLLQRTYKNIREKARRSGWTPILRTTLKIVQNNM